MSGGGASLGPGRGRPLPGAGPPPGPHPPQRPPGGPGPPPLLHQAALLRGSPARPPGDILPSSTLGRRAPGSERPPSSFPLPQARQQDPALASRRLHSGRSHVPCPNPRPSPRLTPRPTLRVTSASHVRVLSFWLGPAALSGRPGAHWCREGPGGEFEARVGWREGRGGWVHTAGCSRLRAWRPGRSVRDRPAVSRSGQLPRSGAGVARPPREGELDATCR